MRKPELVADVASRTGMSQNEVTKVLDELIGAIESELAKGGDVTLTGFGKFSVSHRPARTGRNPATGAPLQIAATNVPRFSAGAKLKQAVN